MNICTGSDSTWFQRKVRAPKRSNIRVSFSQKASCPAGPLRTQESPPEGANVSLTFGAQASENGEAPPFDATMRPADLFATLRFQLRMDATTP